MTIPISSSTGSWYVSISSSSSSSSSTGSDDDSNSTEEQQAFIASSTCVAAFVIILCVSAAYYVKNKKWYWIPESVVSAIIGMIAGGAILIIHPAYLESLIFDPRIFFFVFLPPLIFCAGYNMRRKNFFKYFKEIMVFAVPGTLIAIISSAFALYYLSESGKFGFSGLTLINCFIFSTLISNVDPGVSLGVLDAIHADKQLYSIIFGESVMSDCLVVVLFHTLTKSNETLVITTKSLAELFGVFLGISVGTVAMGVAIGLVASYFFRHSQLDSHPPIETILIILFSYISYALADYLGLSGVVSLFFCGLTLAHFNWYNCSEETRATSRHGVEALSFASETAIYLYLGLNFSFSFSKRTPSLEWNVPFLAVTLALCFISRALGIWILSTMLNVFSSHRRRHISFRQQIIIWISGGLRGSVSFALALNTPDRTPIFLTTTLATVLFTTIVCGGMTERLVALFDLKEKLPDTVVEPMMGNQLTEQLLGDGELMAAEDQGSSLTLRWKRFENGYMKRWFGGRQFDRVYKPVAEAEAEAGGDEPYDPSSITSDGMHAGSMPTIALSPIDDVVATPFLSEAGSVTSTASST